MANLVFNHLDTLHPLGTSQGQRIKKIVELSQENWHSLSSDIAIPVQNINRNTINTKQLKSIIVGPFRGFQKAEDINLNSKIVLIYGPNGTGKSSFCEALEYALLGTVSEAESKRFKPNDYLKNAYLNQYVDPIIKAIDVNGKDFNISPDNSQFRFCFVEKNRIDSFSRIAAQQPAKQTELIASLFGLEQFTDFVRNFTAKMDERYIDLVGKNAHELAQKSQTLALSEQILKDNKDNLEKLSNEEHELALQYKDDITFAELVTILGTSENPGEIDLLDRELKAPIPVKKGLSVKILDDINTNVEILFKNLNDKKQEMLQFREGLSFKKLYSAISELKDITSDCCPSCKTPLSQVVNNPFDLAVVELTKLEHLSILEQEKEKLERNIKSTLKQSHQFLDKMVELEHECFTDYLIDDEAKLDKSWWDNLHQSVSQGESIWQSLRQQFEFYEKQDIELDNIANVRKEKQVRLDKLRNFERQCINLQAKRKQLETGFQSASTLITNFNVENKELIERAKQEEALIIRNKDIAESYDQFVALLENYKEQLPKQLVANLGNTVVDLYNCFNLHDADKDLLSDIKLPLSSGKKIEIAFKGQPEKYFDALHVLSEGHIRCIGLAMLLAKNLKENSPFLIFDDPVNAIDDDHRGAIRKTLFDDDYFKEKQIILTCHGEEFFKDIQNQLSANKCKNIVRYTFLPQMDESHIRIDRDCKPRNYIEAAQLHLEKIEKRDALSSSRRALEVLTKKIWNYLRKNNRGELSLKISSANYHPDLRQLTEQLKVNLADKNFTDAKRDSILLCVSNLLSIDGASLEWRYLNKGTHEESDRAEFELGSIQKIIDNLSSLDNILNS